VWDDEESVEERLLTSTMYHNTKLVRSANAPELRRRGIFLRRHQALLLILFFSLLIFIVLAGWTSYWYDELLVVKVYGTDHESIFTLLQSLVSGQTHPPLYSVILFYWMKLFGDTETSTRLLSSLFIVLSSLFLYLFAEKHLSPRVALASTLVYSLSYTPIYYALQTRPYAQTIFLCILSSFLFWRWLDRSRGDFSWRAMAENYYTWLFIICNTSVLVSHYYNVFFILMQAIFLQMYLLLRNTGDSVVSSVTKVITLYTAQSVLVIAVLAPNVLSVYAKTSKANATQAPTDPLTMVMDLIIRQDLRFMPILVTAVMFVGLTAYVIRTVVPAVRRPWNAKTERAAFFVYLLFWMIGSFLVVYLVFLATGFEKLKPRYFVFAVPPLSILLVLALEQFVGILHRAGKRFRVSVARHYLANALVYALIACTILVVPGAYEAATAKKQPFREIAQSIVSVVEADPKSRYLIYEVGGPKPLLNYYFQKFSPSVRAARTIRMWHEGDARTRLAEHLLEQHDYLVIAFPHFPVSKFPKTMKLLSQTYDLQLMQLVDGKGYVIFRKRS
jgi:uncharacterized membrane protein